MSAISTVDTTTNKDEQKATMAFTKNVLERLFDYGTCKKLHIRKWTMFRRLKQSELTGNELENGLYEPGRLRLMLPSVSRPFEHIESKARRRLDTLSVDFFHDRFVPKPLEDECNKVLADCRVEFFEAVDELIANFDANRDALIAAFPHREEIILNGYPTKDEVRGKYSFDIISFAVALPHAEEMESTHQEMIKRIDEFLMTSVVEIREKITEAISHIAGKIAAGKKVSEANLKTIQRIISDFRKMNFVGDEQIAIRIDELENFLKTEGGGFRNSTDGMNLFCTKLNNIVAAAQEITGIEAATGRFYREIDL